MRDYRFTKILREHQVDKMRVVAIIVRVSLTLIVALTFFWTCFFLVAKHVPTIKGVGLIFYYDNLITIIKTQFSVSQWWTIITVPIYMAFIALWASPKYGLVNYPYWYQKIYYDINNPLSYSEQKKSFYKFNCYIIVISFVYSLFAGVLSGLLMLILFILLHHLVVCFWNTLSRNFYRFCDWISCH